MIENSLVKNLADDPIMNPPEYEDCLDCEGTGGQRYGIQQRWADCPTCDGTGRVPKVKFTIEEK